MAIVKRSHSRASGTHIFHHGAAARVGGHRRSQETGPDVHRLGPCFSSWSRARWRRLIRLQLAVPNNDFDLAADLQPPVHHARHRDGLPGRHADHRRADELSGAADDRRARHGVPAAQRVRLLDVPVRRRCCSISATWPRRAWRGTASAPDVGWFAYAPLTGRAFSRGHSTDYWILASCSSAASAASSRRSTSSPRRSSMRCKGMTLMRMPLFVWMMLVVSVHDSARVAAVDRRANHAAARPVPRRKLLRHAGRRLGGVVAALLLDLRPPGGLHPDDPGVRLRLGDHPGVFAQADLRLRGDGRGDGDDRLHQPGRVGAPHVHGRHDLGGQHVLCRLDDARGGARRASRCSTGSARCRGGKIRLPAADAVLPRLPVSVPHRGADRRHAGGGALRLAAERFLFRRGAFPLRADRRAALHDLRGHLLLVSEGDRPDAEQDDWANGISGCSPSASTSRSTRSTLPASWACRGAFTPTTPGAAGSCRT